MASIFSAQAQGTDRYSGAVAAYLATLNQRSNSLVPFELEAVQEEPHQAGGAAGSGASGGSTGEAGSVTLHLHLRRGAARETHQLALRPLTGGGWAAA